MNQVPTLQVYFEKKLCILLYENDYVPGLEALDPPVPESDEFPVFKNI